MKKTFYSLVAIMAVLTLSCQKAAETEVVLEKESNLRTFKAIFPSNPVDSKVYLHEDGKTGWEIGDVITIHGKYTSELKTITLDGVTNTISPDKKTATFTVALDMTADDYGTDGYFAAYPHSAYAEYESNKARWFNCFDNTNQLLLSGVYNGSDAFVFYNVTGALSFIVDGSSFGGFDEYMIVGNNNEIIGYSHFNTRVATGNISFYHYSTTGPQKTIRATVEDDGTTPNYVFFPATEASDGATELATCVDYTKGFVIYFLKEGVITHMVSTGSRVRIGRQDLLPLGDITSHVKTYTPPTEHDSSIDMEGATALDGSGNANCYIVDGSEAANKNKVFTFKAYKGNSTESVGTINSVELLWETYNTTASITENKVIAAVDFDKQTENAYYTIVFKMPEELKKGNALIAAKNIYGEILWSWHIWVPNGIPATSTYGIMTAAMQDRNLGAVNKATDSEALVDGLSIGLLYQWGRKDPFPGLASTESSTPITLTHPVTLTSSKTNFTVEESIQNPTVYVKTGGDSNKTWMTDEEKGNAYWGDLKTVYDPCPVGYKVASRDNFKSPSITINTTYKWFKFGTDLDIDHPETTGYAVFPVGGYLDQAEYKSRGARAYIWTSYASSGEKNIAYQIYIDGSSSSITQQRMSRGGNVRCVAE